MAEAKVRSGGRLGVFTLPVGAVAWVVYGLLATVARLLHWSQEIIAAVAVSLCISWFAVGLYTVPSGSMFPTIQEGNAIAVSRIGTDDIHRGDIVVFTGGDGWGDADKSYVKRVLGTPGDTVGGCAADGSLLVNDTPVAEPYLLGGSGCDFPTVTVPQGRLWVMGDNRDNSSDSRFYARTDHGFSAEAGSVSADAVTGVMLHAFYWLSLPHLPLFGHGH